MAAAAAEESMAAAAEAEADRVRKWRCRIRDCECCWLYLPQIPRIAPGRDHVCIPAGADHRPAWSLLVGVTDGISSLRVSRIRVARSGRILGRSDDKLVVFHDILLAKQPKYSFDAGAALAPDGRSLCVLRKHARKQTQALQLSLDNVVELPLPEIEGTIPCMPISAAGHIWAVSATVRMRNVTVVIRRLDGGSRRWEQVGDPFTSQLMHSRLPLPEWGGWFLQGYAVLNGGKLILVSLQQYGLFLTFAPDDSGGGCWTLVCTDETRSEEYLPLKGRAIYMEQHDAVYMLWENTIYAYKLTRHQHDEQLSLDPPMAVDLVCPFSLDKGYGFLTRLADRLMCSVWISLAMHDPCSCDHLHAIVTTFQLRDRAQGGFDVLHSTYRRVDIVPYPSRQEFFFLQEYEDKGSPALLLQHEEEQEDSSQQVNEPSKKLACCRSRMESLSITPRCFKCGVEGHIAYQCTENPERTISTIPPLGPSRSLPVDPASRQHQVPSSSPVMTLNPATTTIKKKLFLVFQAGSQSVVFQTGAMDGDGKPLKPYNVPNNDYRHFLQSGPKIYAVSCIGDGMLDFSLNKYRTTIKQSVRRPTDPFTMVISVGGEIIAVTDGLGVFHQAKYSTAWLPYKINGLDVVCRKVVMTGYVVVSDDSFIVCDAVTRSCLLFDMGAKQWRVVMPWDACEEDLQRTIRTNGLLNGRCVFVDGFIYTCRNGGLAAYELVGEGRSVFIGKPIFLPFSWHADCMGEDMCLDYAGKDMDSGAILFYVVVRGGYSPPKHDVQISTVKVKTKRRAGNKMIPAGVDCVGSVTRSIRHKKAIETRCCFAV